MDPQMQRALDLTKRIRNDFGEHFKPEGYADFSISVSIFSVDRVWRLGSHRTSVGLDAGGT